jgi:prefoldin subunit 5
MTVASAQNRAGPFNGDGVSTQFDFNVPAQKDRDIAVFRRHVASGLQTQLAFGSDYSLARTFNGGRVTLATALPVGYRLVIVRVPEAIQEADLIENGTYSAETIEAALDYIIMVAARQSDRLDRALVLADSDSPGSGAFNAGGNRITSAGDAVGPTDLTTLSQVQALVGSGGGGSGPPSGWPTSPIPPDIQQGIIEGVITAAEFTAVFAPINSSLGNLANQILGQNSTISSFSSSLGTINTSISSMQAAIALLQQINGDEENVIALIETESEARVDGDTALATLISRIGAAGSGTAFILDLNTVQVSPTETLGVRLSSISSSLASSAAAINTETTARTTADAALAQTISKIGASSTDGVSFILNLDSVRVLPGETLGQRLNQIASATNAATAAVSSEAVTRAAADSSFAATLSTLQSTVGGFTSSIQTLTTSVNGVQAQYSVKIDNNGRVSGFGLISQPINGTIVSTFNFNADVFRIWNGTSNVAPFVVEGGVVKIQNAQIENAAIANCSIDKLTVGTLNANMNIGSGRIVLDNGSVMKVTGTGFGTTSQFVEWFGPHLASIDLCSEANAEYYLKIDGSSYFGGSLTAGTIKNSGRSTSLASNAEFILGPFGTLGNTKTVVFSYGYTSTLVTGGGGGNSSGATSATIQCYRRIGAGSETNIATLNATGTYSIESEPGLSVYEQSMGGSVTFTDNVAGTDNRTFRAIITARALGFAGGSAVQNLGITSIEE